MRPKGEEPTNGLNSHRSNKVNAYKLRRHGLSKFGADTGYTSSQLRAMLSTMRERISRRRMAAAAVPLAVALVSWFAIPSFAASPATVQFSESITNLTSGQSSAGMLVASPGDRLQVTLNLQNISSFSVPNAVLVHDLASLPITGVQISGGAESNGKIGWQIGALAPGVRVQLTFTATTSSTAAVGSSACAGVVGVVDVHSASSADAVAISPVTPLCIQIRVPVLVSTSPSTTVTPAASPTPKTTPSSSPTATATATATPCVDGVVSIAIGTDKDHICAQVGTPSATATPSPSLLPPPVAAAAASQIPPAGAVQALTTLAANTSFGASPTPATGTGIILLRNSVAGICLFLSGLILITGIRRNPHEVY